MRACCLCTHFMIPPLLLIVFTSVDVEGTRFPVRTRDPSRCIRPRRPTRDPELSRIRRTSVYYRKRRRHQVITASGDCTRFRRVYARWVCKRGSAARRRKVKEGGVYADAGEWGRMHGTVLVGAEQAKSNCVLTFILHRCLFRSCSCESVVVILVLT